jgi:hypothetical protein
MNPSTSKAQIPLGPCQSCPFIRAQTLTMIDKKNWNLAQNNKYKKDITNNNNSSKNYKQLTP